MFHCYLTSYNDVRSLLSDEYEINVANIKNTDTYAWHGGKKLATSKDFNDLCVTKKMYDELGHNICKKKFNID